MKKLVKTIISTILILSFIIPFAIPVSAAFEVDKTDRIDYTNPELDLSKYTIQQIADMPKDELLALIADFERVYGPFPGYEASPQPVQKELGVQPLWASGEFEDDGSLDMDKMATHEAITAQAFVVMSNDVGFFFENAPDMIAALIWLMYYSAKPDDDEWFMAFEGHFYHGVTHDNYLGSRTDTALTRIQSHYNKAILQAKLGNGKKALMEIGRALHYIQDVCQPHHAANITAGQNNSAHEEFESYVNQGIEKYTDGIESADMCGFEFYEKYNYLTVVDDSIKNLVDGAAMISFIYSDYVNDGLDKSRWNSAAYVTVKNSVVFSSLLMHRFSVKSNWRGNFTEWEN